MLSVTLLQHEKAKRKVLLKRNCLAAMVHYGLPAPPSPDSTRAKTPGELFAIVYSCTQQRALKYQKFYWIVSIN